MTAPRRGGGGGGLEVPTPKERWGVSPCCRLLLLLSVLTLHAHGQLFRPDPAFQKSSQTFGVIADRQTWWYTNFATMDSYARLATPTETLEHFMVSQPTRFSQQHWLGVARVPTRWKWLDGSELLTYRGEVSVPVDMAIQHVLESEGDAFSCLLKCQTAFVAIQGPNCFCYESLPDTRTSADTDQCPRDIYCFGSREGASVYDYSHLAETFPWNADSDTGIVAFTGKVPPANIACFYSSNPSRDRRYLCKTEPTQHGVRLPTWDSYNCSGKLCASSYETRLSWDLARSSCSKYTRTDLASLTASDFDSLATVTSEWEELWIGLYRETVAKTVDGSDFLDSVGKELPPGWLCLSASVQRSSKGSYAWHLQYDNCSTSLPAIYELPVDSSQDAVTTSTLAIPTSLTTSSLTPNLTSNDTTTTSLGSMTSADQSLLAVGVTFGTLFVICAVILIIRKAARRYTSRSTSPSVPPLPPVRDIPKYVDVYPDPSNTDGENDYVQLPILNPGPLPMPPSVPEDYDYILPIPPSVPAWVPPSVPPNNDHEVPPNSDHEVPPNSDHEVPLNSDHEVPPNSDHEVPPNSDHEVPPNRDHEVPPNRDYEVPIPCTGPPPVPTDVDPDESIYEELPEINQALDEAQTETMTSSPKTEDVPEDFKDDEDPYEAVGMPRIEERGQTNQTHS